MEDSAIVDVPAVADTAPFSDESTLDAGEKPRRHSRSKLAKPEAAATANGAGELATDAAALSQQQERKRKPRAKVGAPETIADDGPNLASLVDLLRGRGVPTQDGEQNETLPPVALELFGRCAKDYQRESYKPAHRRRRIGALVYPATSGQATLIGEWFVQALGLRMVQIDARSLIGLSDEDVADRLAPLTESMARIVAIHAIGLDTDARVFAAIASADVDVLVIAFADPDAKLRAAVQRRLRYRIDLRTYQLDVVPGVFDGLRHEQAPHDGPEASHDLDEPDEANEATVSFPSPQSLGRSRTLFERFVNFFRRR